MFTFGFFQRGWEPFELAFTWVVEGGRGRGASGDSSSALLARCGEKTSQESGNLDRS